MEQQDASKKLRLYGNTSGSVVEITGELADPVRFSSQGGGLVRSMPKAAFLAEFKEAEALPSYKLVRVTADWLPDGLTVAAFSDGWQWNGWALPRFTLEVGKSLMGYIAGLRYDQAKDAFVATPEPGAADSEEETYEGFDLVVDGVRTRAYAIGAGSWCWETVG